MGTVAQLVLVFCATLPLIACARNDPPGIGATAPAATHGLHVGTDAAALPAAKSTIAIDAGDSRSPARGPISSQPASTAGIIATQASVPERQKAEAPWQPALLDSTNQPLPQTNDRPTTTSPSFQRRIELLCEAIIEGQPTKAHDAFFPLVAYSQVKAVADPGRDYRLRLLSHFDRDILDYHRRIAKRSGPLRCGGITVPENSARWMKPGSEYNKLGYYRVLRSSLRITDANDKATVFEVTSLISWRGEWYVVHLNGFE